MVTKVTTCGYKTWALVAGRYICISRSWMSCGMEIKNDYQFTVVVVLLFVRLYNTIQDIVGTYDNKVNKSPFQNCMATC